MNPATDNAPPVLSAQDLTMIYGKGSTEVRALDGISVQIQSGKWTSIMGQSGSGKTTLLQCLSGLAQPTSGRVTLNKNNITLSSLSENKRAKLRRTHISMVFQDFNLVPILSVKDNILLPLRLAHRRVDLRVGR